MLNPKKNNKMTFISQKKAVPPVEWKPSQPLENDNYERFCQEYSIDLNGTQAAIRCGYSPVDAGNTAYNLKKIPEIQKRLLYLQKQRSKKCSLTAVKVIKAIEAIACNPNISDYIRLDALKTLGKHFSLFTDKIEINERPKRIIIANSDDEIVEELGDE